jgi:hypothetical protein
LLDERRDGSRRTREEDIIEVEKIRMGSGKRPSAVNAAV